MAKNSLPSLQIILFIIVATATTTRAAFIETECQKTRYPVECVKFLSPHASQIQQNELELTRTALAVSFEKTRDLKTSLTSLANLKGLKAGEHAALKDCLDEVDDSLEQLTQSAQEFEALNQSRGDDFLFHKSNLQTWVSAVISNHDSCTESFVQPNLNGRIKSSVTSQADEVDRVTSNALAFINNLPPKN